MPKYTARFTATFTLSRNSRKPDRDSSGTFIPEMKVLTTDKKERRCLPVSRERRSPLCAAAYQYCSMV